jgi:hypothetical protein
MKLVMTPDQIRREEERSLTMDEFRSLPWPTEEQCEAFVTHVCDAHSWYKHLSLRNGGEFCFFLAKDAGAGYSEESPRPHYSWQTTEEYRSRFGFLDFTHPGGRDAAPMLTLPHEIIKATRIFLHPYVCESGDPEAILWGIHAQDISLLMKQGASTQAEENALKWYTIERCLESLPPLSDAESAQLDGLLENANYVDIDITSLSEAIAGKVRVTQESISVYCEIQSIEKGKIRDAVSCLRVLHKKVDNESHIAS